MTISELCRGRATLQQYTVLQRADVLFRHSVGRYFGGLLTNSEIALLLEGIDHAATKHDS